MAEKPCLFCSVPAGQVIIEQPLARAVRDSYPVSNGHALIVPRRHVVTFFETTEEERMAIMRLLGLCQIFLCAG